MSQEPIIRAEHVSVIYNEGKSNEYTALSDISLEVYPEEYLIFFGPSGSGKSTMLYTLLGLQPPSRGTVYVEGQDSSTFSETKKSKTTSQYFGIIFQNFNLVYSLNVLDNVVLPQVFINVPVKERKQKAAALLERFGIATRARDLPNNLSGGQQQRVAICRSLINDPRVLLADEPVGNLDSESARVVMQTLSEINHKDKKTIILVTHDASYLPYADRVYYFKDANLEKVVKNEHPVVLGESGAATQAKSADTGSYEELERLGNVHQSLTVPELKAWVLTHYLMKEMTAGQTKRLEKYMEGVLDSSISPDDFYTCLRAPYAKGGVGLYRTTAAKYFEKVKQVITIVNNFKSYSYRSNHHQRQALIHLLRRFILNEYDSEMAHSQITRVEQAIVARLKSEITSDEFALLLHRPLSEGGTHLRQSTAYHLAEKLDIILAEVQPIYASS